MLNPDLSVVIPTYNSIEKMSRTIHSLDEASNLMNMEVVFVDDGSGDDTFARLKTLAESRSNWSVHQLEANSGSAAKPRNTGIEIAKGKYVYFLDSDDFLEPRGLENSLSLALQYGYELVRSSLKVEMGDKTTKVSDLIPGWDKISDPVERKRAITKHQSLTCSCLIQRSILIENGIRFDEHRRIGEDIKFTADVLQRVTKIGYRAIPARTYVRNAVGVESVTQKINSEQFLDFIKSWKDVEDRLSEVGISFIREHGHSAVQYALRQFLWFKTEDLNESVFEEFADFCVRFKADLRNFKFAPRYREIVDAAIDRKYDKFVQATQLRMLIAGHDLKFMDAIRSAATEQYLVDIDQWDGHNKHDEKLSMKKLAWADIVWVEWMLGAAAWYSGKIRGDQRLVIRAHRSELVAQWGEKVNFDRVSAVVSIAPQILADFADRFDIPREKMWLIPNSLDIDAYEKGEYTDERLSRIAMVGIVPRLKGFKRGIQLLGELAQEFPKLELWTYGKQPEELKWVWENAAESAYYKQCERLADQLGVRDRIVHKGWVDTKTDLHEVAAVCSFSDFEGMQVAVSEGFCSGGVGITLNWRGAEEGYPREFVFEDIEQMADYLRRLLHQEIDLKQESEIGLELVKELYDISSVWESLTHMLKSIRA